eukprot:INCI5089.9.p2 GENE.INCI5089.9~~INCI5089.9.p2  ORF type:complete len:772 (-),score=119.28 INCI5089.9:4147-6462(-)
MAQQQRVSRSGVFVTDRDGDISEFRLVDNLPLPATAHPAAALHRDDSASVQQPPILHRDDSASVQQPPILHRDESASVQQPPILLQWWSGGRCYARQIAELVVWPTAEKAATVDDPSSAGSSALGKRGGASVCLSVTPRYQPRALLSASQWAELAPKMVALAHTASVGLKELTNAPATVSKQLRKKNKKHKTTAKKLQAVAEEKPQQGPSNNVAGGASKTTARYTKQQKKRQRLMMCMRELKMACGCSFDTFAHSHGQHHEKEIRSFSDAIAHPTSQHTSKRGKGLESEWKTTIAELTAVGHQLNVREADKALSTRGLSSPAALDDDRLNNCESMGGKAQLVNGCFRTCDSLASSTVKGGQLQRFAPKRFHGIDWEQLPKSLHMMHHAKQKTGAAREQRRGDVRRLQRKRRQCDAFAAAVHALNLPSGTSVVDFGCGSCGLTLPLAWTFPHLKFTGVDIKQQVLMEDCLVARVLPNPSNRELFIRNALLRTHLQTTPPQALDLMASRAVEGGLTNVTTHCGSVAGYHHQVGLVLALHACGQASDEAMMQAVRCSCPYLIAPCCVGKVKFGFEENGRTEPESEADDRLRASATRARRGAQQRAFALQRPKVTGGPRRRTGGLEAEKKRRRGFINNMGLEKDGVLVQLKYPRSRWLRKQLGEWSQSQLPGPEDSLDSVSSEDQGSKPPDSRAGANQHFEADRAQRRYAAIAAGADNSEMHNGAARLHSAPSKADSSVGHEISYSAQQALDEIADFSRTCAKVRFFFDYIDSLN